MNHDIQFFEGEFSFLSNFYPSPITLFGITFPTVEHFYQAAKATNEEDTARIAAAETPGQAKRLGRITRLRSDWESIKIDVMRLGLEEKFKDPLLRLKLLDTGNTPLVEGNFWHDNTWGNCQCEKCQTILGRNILGKLLMDLRTRLQNQLEG